MDEYQHQPCCVATPHRQLCTEQEGLARVLEASLGQESAPRAGPAQATVPGLHQLRHLNNARDLGFRVPKP